jgi:Family of unknown function (DUF5686)/CarboxypepD_reg-like domain
MFRQSVLLYKTLLLLFLSGCCVAGMAQRKALRGIIKDSHSDERIPFASILFKNSTVGGQSDSSGSFAYRLDEWPSDTLVVSCVGYKPYFFRINRKSDTAEITILMERASFSEAVTVKAKVNKGLLVWRRIVKNKPLNNRSRFENFSYELYNKLELDLNRINKEKMKEIKLFRPFGFVFNNVDTTSEEKPFLPVFLTETISDFYHENEPVNKSREVIRASKTTGINNESVSKLLGGMYQNINVYNNFIPVFDKEFISPISDNGSSYYLYRVADTQYLSGKTYYHLVFTPKRKGENTFEGDCYVNAPSYAIQKMNLRLSKEANINFVDKLSLIQEFSLINDSTWFLSKDKFVVDIAPVGKTKFGFTGRKTSTYKNIIINSSSVITELNKSKLREQVIILPDAQQKADEYWKESRHETLSKNENSIYAMIDTLQKMPLFKRYTNTINFIGTGYLGIGNYQIGPWFNWVTGNAWEGTRVRFDLGTNRHFNKNIILHGYLAYGFGDKRLKGEIDAFYLPKRNPRTYIYAQLINDLDWGQSFYDEIGGDNIFALAVRKPGVPIKFMKMELQKLEFFKETAYGLSGLLSIVHKRYEPLRNLPLKENFMKPGLKGDLLNDFEFSFRLRFAYLEKFLENNFYRSSLGSPYPIVEVRYTRGVSGIMRSSYDYHKISGSISDYLKIPPYGSLYFNVFGGKIYGTLPYMFLETHPGNEMYYYNKYAFNMMNRFEYISDEYLGFNIEHNFGNGIFRFLPITRKLRFRQFWTLKGLWGSLNQANKDLNFVPDHPFQALDGKTYMEAGTGVDNIFRVFRLDFIWRLLPRPFPVERYKRFGVFGSFRLAF